MKQLPSKRCKISYYTQSGLISTMVNVSVLMVLKFSQKFSTNGSWFLQIFSYYGPNFCKKNLALLVKIVDRYVLGK